MDEQIKPVAWAFAQDWASFQTDRQECRLIPNFYWGDDLSADADFAPLYDQQAIDTLREQVNRLLLSGREWATRFGEQEARAERAEAEARRWRFCIERDVMPVVASDGKTWCMFVSVTSRRRSLFTGKSPAEAVDAAIDAAKQGAE